MVVLERPAASAA